MNQKENNYTKWFSSLYEQFAPLMIKSAKYRLFDEEKASELTHDVFVLLWAKRNEDKIQNHPNIGGWLMKALEYNICNNIRNMDHKTISLDESISGTLLSQPQRGLKDILPSGLSEEQKMLLILRFEQELDYKTIAEIMRLPSDNSCRMRMLRTQKKLKELLGSENNT